MSSGGDSAASSRYVGYACVLGAMLVISTNGICSSLIFDSGLVSPRQLAAVRVYGSAIVLAPFAFRARPALSRRDWAMVAAFGVFGVSLPQWSYFESISRIPVTIALVIIYTAPILVNVYERVVRKRHLPRLAWAAIAVAVGGVVLSLLAGGSDGGPLAALGVIFAIVCTLLYAVQIVVWSKQPAQLNPLAGCGLGMIVGAVFWLAVSPAWALPFKAANQPVSLGSNIGTTLPLWFMLAYAVVIGTVVPYVLLIAGTPRIGPGAGSVTGMVEPAASAVWAWLVLSQTLTGWQSIGVAISLIGVAVAEVLRATRSSGSVDPVDTMLPLDVV